VYGQYKTLLVSLQAVQSRDPSAAFYHLFLHDEILCEAAQGCDHGVLMLFCRAVVDVWRRGLTVAVAR